MGLVHRHQGDVRCLRKGAEALRFQPLRRHVDDLVPSRFGPVQGQQVLAEGEAAVEIGRRHPHLHQGRHLVPHEGHQRRDHDGNARQQQRRDLVAHGLARSRGHDGHHIPAGKQRINDRLLSAPERVIAKICF